MLIAILVGIIALSIVQILRRSSGLTVRDVGSDAQPMTLIAPEGGRDLPVVVIAHGFAGSQQLMLGYAYTFAQAGYAALLFDFPGHGVNPMPFQLDDDNQRQLQMSLAAAIETAIGQPEADGTRITLLGHSMGTGVVLRKALSEPERYKLVIAVSPTSTRWVAESGYDTTTLPNLLLQAGQFEPPFVRNAERWLALAGGQSAGFDNGTARTLDVIPAVEHISILFSSASHLMAREWVGASTDQPSNPGYGDRRIVWYGLQLAAWLALLTAAAPLWRERVDSAESTSTSRTLFGLAAGVLAAITATFVLGQFVAVGSIGGLQVGGGLGVWFLLLGSVWFAISKPAIRLQLRDIGLGLGLFAALFVAFNLLAGAVWMPTRLVTPRLLRWPLLALAVFPMLLASASAEFPGGFKRRLLWWLALSAAIFVGLIITMLLVDGLGFLALLLPLLPAILAIVTIAGATVRRPYAYAIGTALWFSYTLMAVFPLAS